MFSITSLMTFQKMKSYGKDIKKRPSLEETIKLLEKLTGKKREDLEKEEECEQERERCKEFLKIYEKVSVGLGISVVMFYTEARKRGKEKQVNGNTNTNTTLRTKCECPFVD